MKYSTTFIAQLAQWISVVLLGAGIVVGVGDLTITLTVLANVLTGLMVFYGRWRVGDITWYGARK